MDDNTWVTLMIISINGDGKTDILTRTYNTNAVASPVIDPSNQNNSYTNSAIPILGESGNTSGGTIETAEWDVWYSTGTSFVKKFFKGFTIDVGSGTYTENDNYINGVGQNTEMPEIAQETFDPLIADFNGDGKADILFNYSHIHASGSNPYNFALCTDLDMYYSTGLGFVQNPPGGGLIASGLTGMDARYSVMGDFNGDGQSDISFYNVGVSPWNTYGLTTCSPPITTLSYTAKDDYFQFSFNPKSQNRLLQQVLDGFDQLKTFTYTLLTDPHGIHRRGSNATYPLVSVQPPMKVVSEISVPDGAGGFNVTDYNYQDAESHLGGRGFLGFTTTSTIFNFNGTQSYVYVNFKQACSGFPTDIPYIALPYLSGNYTTSSHTPNSQTQRTTNILKLQISSTFGSAAAVQRFAVQKSQDINNNELTGSVTTVSYSYDNYGNITTQLTNVNNTEWTNVFAQYVPTGIVTIPNQPSFVATIKSRSGAQVYTDVTSYQYNNPGGHVTQKITGVGKSCGLKYTMGYNHFGNLTNQTSNFVNPPPGPPNGNRSQSYTYDGLGRLPLTKTNTLGQIETYTYDQYTQLWGKPHTDKTIDGLTTTYTYDAFGRTSIVQSPRGFNITTNYAWDIGYGATQSIYSVSTVQPHAPTVTVWNDALGRQVSTTQQGFGSQGLLTSNTFYNNHGKVAATDGPYYPNQPASYKGMTYDNFDNPSTITDQFGTTTISYSYPGDGTVVQTIKDPAGRLSGKIIDATGKLIQASDNGGTLTYKYDSYGNQTEVDMGGHAVLTTQYDECEHQSSATEPNSGTYTYHYDGYGELLRQSDANNNTYTMSYDIGGRISSRLGPEGLTSYTYVPTGQNGVNKPKTVTESNGTSQSYDQYDQYSQLKEMTEVIPNPVTGASANLHTFYNYDNYGNLTSTLYPSNLLIDYNYDPSTSYMTSIVDDNTSATLYTVNTMDQYGHATNYTTGNGATSSMTTYYGVPINYTTPGVQNLSLTYDWLSRDLMQRTDNILGLEETFGYDQSDRLISSQVGTNAAMTYNYAGNGNITNKTDVGDYTYEPTQINAVHGVTNIENNISLNTQNITYTGFNKAAKITENGYELDYTYGPDYNRKFSVLKNGSTVANTHTYSGSYEVYDDQTGHPIQLHYINGNNGLIAIITVDNSGAATDYYTYTDQLGSILRLTDASGNVITGADQNFDAWGRNRNPADWTYTGITPNTLPWLYRGYTGHEMLPQFALVNMNGRMYDPLLGRMLSPDNVIHDPTGTQYYNRYSYAFNNPLKFTDPTGWDGENGGGDWDDFDWVCGGGDDDAPSSDPPSAAPSYNFAGNDLNSSSVNYNSNGNTNSIASISGEATPEVNMPSNITGNPDGLMASIGVSGSSFFDPMSTTDGIVATIAAPSFNCNVPIDPDIYNALFTNNNPYSDFSLLQTSNDAVLTASNNSTKNSNSPDRVDYYNINIAVGGVVGLDLSISMDNFGRVYVGGGFEAGYSSTVIGVSITSNTLLQSSPPNKQQIYNVLSGESGSAGGGFVYGITGGNSPYSGGTQFSVGQGLFTPQLGVGVTWTPPWAIFNIR